MSNSESFDTTPDLSSSKPGSTNVVVGSQLGPYKLQAKLGEGGMGVVYKAVHVKLGRTVALKVLSPHVLARPDALSRFEREMKAAGTLNHPNIVQALDAGEFEGIHYLSMEFVEGRDLHELVKNKGPMSVTDACNAILQAAQGLAVAHQVGLVHRDIKPSNLILVQQTGSVKILDMGLAFYFHDEIAAPLTSVGHCLGTPDYIAPEQWEDAHACDARADLYALGCTLFTLLVGRAPYATDAYRTIPRKMVGHVSDPIPDLIASCPNIPAEVNAIYRKLMAKRPSDRFQSAAELQEALAPFSHQKPLIQLQATVCDSSATKATQRRSSRWQTLFAVRAVAVLLVAIGLAFVVKETLFKATDVPSARSNLNRPSPVSDDVALNRKISERVLGLKGSVRIKLLSESRFVSDVAGLPNEQFEVEAIDLTDRKNVGRQDFEIIGQAPQLKELYLPGTPIDDQMIASLCNLGELEVLDLMKTRVTDPGISVLVGLKRLRRLNLTFTAVGDDGMTSVSKLTKLQRLYLGEAPVGDVGLRRLETLKDLEFISIGARVTDEGLIHLTEFGALTEVANLKSNHMTPVGISALKKIPKLRGLNVVNASDADLERLESSLNYVSGLAFNYNTFTAEGFKRIAAFKQLEVLSISHNRQFDDSCLMHLLMLPDLQRVELTGTGVTADGVAKFRELRPNVAIVMNDVVE